MRKVCLAAFAVVLYVGLSAAAAADTVCSDAMANRGAKIIYTVGDWRQLYTFYRHFEGCDEYTIAEGISDRVVDLLANRWDTLADLQDMLELHPAFEDFVIGHIDRLMMPDRQKAIVANATTRCPANLDALCRKIAARAQKFRRQ